MNMASSAAHPAFPSRYGSSALGKLPERPMTTFGTSTNQQRGDQQRAERERERLEREHLEREAQNQLSEEQKEEIREAVHSKSSANTAPRSNTLHSLRSSIWTRTRKLTITSSKSP